MKRLFSFILSLVLCTVALANATNRKVVNAASTTVEQVPHYYPYGGVIGDISTQESTQKYKFEGKELDRSFGLDNYDIHARNYFAMLPRWDRVDPLAEKYYGISPYVYCAGDPVNWKDVDGKWIQCAIGASGGGLLYRLAVNSIGDAVVETLGQVAEISINERETLSETEITHAFVGGVVSTAGGEAFSKGLKNTIKTVTNTDSFIRSSKTKAKQYLQGIKESSVSTANDKEVKDLAKSLRDQDRKLFEKTGERVAGGALQGVTSYGNREFDKKNEK